MRIGIYDPYLDAVSGGEKYMLTIASYFSKNNLVEIFWNPEKEAEIKEISEDKFNIDLSRVNFVENIFSPNISTLKRAVISRKYDCLIYLSDGSIPLVFPKKLVLHFQFPVEGVNSSIKTKIKMLQRPLFICNSFFTKRYIDKKFSVNSKVIYPPVDLLEDVEGFINKKEDIILTVGRYEKLENNSTFKKQEFLLESFKMFSQITNKKCRFYIVTSSKDNENKEFIKSLEKNSKGFNIEILNNVSKQDVVELYKKSKIYWHAAGYGEDLELHPERAEHFGIATVEAMSSGCVPVVFSAGGQEEIVEDGKNGYLWKEGKKMMEKTKLLLNDQGLFQVAALNAIERSNDFDKSYFFKKLNEIIR